MLFYWKQCETFIIRPRRGIFHQVVCCVLIIVMPVVHSLAKHSYKLVEDKNDGLGKVPAYEEEAFQLGITFKAKVGYSAIRVACVAATFAKV